MRIFKTQLNGTNYDEIDMVIMLSNPVPGITVFQLGMRERQLANSSAAARKSAAFLFCLSFIIKYMSQANKLRKPRGSFFLSLHRVKKC